MNSKIWLGASALLMVTALYMVFIYVPTEATMGIVQRIFYLMVPLGWLALLSFLIVFTYYLLSFVVSLFWALINSAICSLSSMTVPFNRSS